MGACGGTLMECANELIPCTSFFLFVGCKAWQGRELLPDGYREGGAEWHRIGMALVIHPT